MKKETIMSILATLLLMMFLHTGASKLLDFEGFHHAMLKQPFPHWLAWVLSWVLPVIEIGISVCLIFEKTRKNGFYASAVIMGVFTLYIVAVLLHVFRWVPCTCGGVIKYLSWTNHLYFNLIFLAMALAGVRSCTASNRKQNSLKTRKSYSKT